MCVKPVLASLLLLFGAEMAWAGSAGKAQGPHGSHDPHSKLSSDQHLMVALQHQQEGREAEAMFTLDKAIANFQEDAKLRLVRGSMLLQKQQISKALEDFEQAVKLAPDSPEAYVSRAQAYRHFGRVQDSLADLDKAIQLQADSVPARFNRGALHFSQENYELALADFDYCVAVDPHTAAPYFNRAATFDAMGKHEQAIADMERFIELSGDNPQWQQAARETLRKWSEDSAGADKG